MNYQLIYRTKGLFQTRTFTYTKDNQSFSCPIVFADLNIIQILKSITFIELFA